ncbi:ribosomal silencing factor RsfS [bacterium BMS3Abin10]|nr:ribosomal silencing factor RsfS [bacterium BMS3Abin10]GBE39214.1 ribosomal silencing factor RsfS [bacterium BMS3Bbin08]
MFSLLVPRCSLLFFRREGSPLVDSKKKAIKAAKTANSKKAKDILVLELKDISSIADYFVICSGESSTQVKAIAEAIDEKFSKDKMQPLGREGVNFARWILMDYGDVVVHIFDKESRDYYELEKLWLDAPRVSIEKQLKPAIKRQKASK